MVARNLSEHLNQRETCFAKIAIPPWNALTLTESAIPQPSRKIKHALLHALLEIYKQWKIQLDQIGQPYYLSIWLFEPRFAQSQVVCAVGNALLFYDNAFFKPSQDKRIIRSPYGRLIPDLEKLHWEYCFDEDHYDNTDLGDPTDYASPQEYEAAKRGFDRLLKQPHRLQ